MANKTFQGRIVQKHDTKANWDKATNFIPLKGEIIVYDDLNKIKIGDGTTKVGNLAFISNSYNDLINKPTKLSEFTNDTNYATQDYVDQEVNTVKETIPTKVSDLTDDVVNGKYLPLTGGTMTGDINTSNNNINNVKSLSFKDRLNENETPLYGYIINNTGRLDAAGIRPDGDYTFIFDTYTSNEPEALIERLVSEGESMPIITLRNIAEPLTYYDAVNKKYVDDQIATNKSSTTIITWSDSGT